MGMQGYGLYHRLLNEGHSPERMGFKGTAGEIARWYSRMKLARNFRGLQVDGFAARTLLGYYAFFRVFLTHSALELYRPIVGLAEGDMADTLLPHKPHEPIKRFFALDPSGRLFDFLHAKLRPKLRTSLAACRDGTCCDVACIASAVRHIFAHGHLSANANDIEPRRVARACAVISDFLLEFMECDFSRRIAVFYQSLAPSSKVSS
jgi:hypothetical protein